MKKTAVQLAATTLLVMASVSAWAQGAMHQGKVLETMNSGGYTYVHLQEGDKTLWAAAPQADIAKGDTVVVAGAGWMKDFHSKTLNRTFAKLLFASKIDKQ